MASSDVSALCAMTCLVAAEQEMRKLREELGSAFRAQSQRRLERLTRTARLLRAVLSVEAALSGWPDFYLMSDAEVAAEMERGDL